MLLYCYIQGMQHPSTKIMGYGVCPFSVSKFSTGWVISSDIRMESMQYIFCIKTDYEQILIYSYITVVKPESKKSQLKGMK
jgi:hypothetical protein